MMKKNVARSAENIFEEVKYYFPNGMRADRLTEDYIDLMVKAGDVNLESECHWNSTVTIFQF